MDGGATTAFGSTVVGGTASRTYTVRNTGNAALGGVEVTFGGAHAADFSVTTPPAVTVAPGDSSSFTVAFTPGGYGARTAAMMIVSNDADENPFDVALSGSGTATPPTVRTINATDRGWYNASGSHDGTNLNYVTGYATDAPPTEFRSFFVFSIPALGPNETITAASLRLWNPSNGYSSADATEMLELHDVGTPLAALIGGTGGTAAFADLADGPLFGGPHTVSAADNGTFVTIPLNSDFVAAAVLKTGNSMAVGAILNALAGNRPEYIFGYTQSDGNLAETQLVLTTVTSYSDAEIVVEQPAGTGLVDGSSSVNFGGIAPGTTADRVFTIRNVGIYDLTGLGITLTGANASDFSVTASPTAPVATAGITSFTVRFAPATGGLKNAVLSIASNDPDENPFEIAVAGTAVVPAPEIVVEQPVGTSLVDGTAAVDFGFRATGTNGSLVLSVRNTGTADLTWFGITIDGANAADFSVTAAPTAPVAPGGSTTLTVQFAPSVSGLRTAALHLANNDSDENPFDISLSGRGYSAPAGLDFKILSLGTTGSAVVDHDSLTGDDRGGIAVTLERVFVTGDNATSGHALADLSGGASIGRVSNGICSDIGTGIAYVLANNGVEISGSGSTVSQLIELNPLTGTLTGTIIPLSSSFVTGSGSGVFSGNGRVVIHTGTRVFDILVPSGVVTDLGAMSAPAWYGSESWAVWGVAEFFDGSLHLAYRSGTGSTIVRSRVPDGQVQTIATFSNLSDMASWTVSPVTNRWYFHHEYSSQFGGSSETLGYADATFEQGPPTQPPAIISPLAAVTYVGLPFNYQIRASRAPTSFQATGLPAGLGVNTASGLISGSVGVPGVYPVTISATNVVGTTTETLTITTVNTPTSFFDDFDPGIDTPLWSAFGGTVTANTAGQAAGAGSTGNSLHFDGDGSRFATTVAMDTRGISAMSFLFALANGGGSPWENADSGEEVVLEYSADGTTFTQVGGPYSNRTWQLTTVALPVAAKTAATLFRWRQLSNSGSSFDNWAIDDVRINAGVTIAPEIAVEQPAGTGLTDGISTCNFGSVATGANTSLTFTVRNSGSANLTGLAVTFDGANAADFTLTTPLAATVAPGATATFVVRFAPGAAGNRTAALHLASDDADENPFDVALVGTGFIPVPEIAVEQPAGTGLTDGLSSVAFGPAVPGSYHEIVFSIRNTGTGVLSGLSVSFSGGQASAFSLASAMPTSLASGATGSFTVRFAPSTQGSYSTSLQIASNDADENPFDIALTGSSVNAVSALINFDGLTAPTSFVDQTRPISDYAPASVTFTNTTMKVLNQGGSFGVSGHSAPNFLAWNASITTSSVTLEFPVPVSAFSLKTGSNSGGTGTLSAYDGSNVLLYSTTVPLSSALSTIAVPSSQVSRVVFSATGSSGVIDDISYLITAPAEIAVEQPVGVNLTDGPATTDFGPAAEPVTRVFTLRNTGGASLQVSGITLDGTHAADFRVIAAPASAVAPGGTATFSVRFTPSALGARTAALHIASNDADENPFDIALTATAITPAGGFDNWLPPALPDRTPTGTPHHDGVPNLLKYAFNMDVNAPDNRTIVPGATSGLPSIQLQQVGSMSVFRFEYLRRIGSGLVYTPEMTVTLAAGSWTPLVSAPVITPVNEFWERVVHEEPVDPLTMPIFFGRVWVLLP